MPAIKSDDKLKAVKEELEEVIEELKSDVDEKGQFILENKKLQEESFELMFSRIDRLKDELKVLGMHYSSRLTLNIVAWGEGWRADDVFLKVVAKAFFLLLNRPCF